MRSRYGGAELQKQLHDMVQNYGNRIYRLALKYTGDHGQAQDLTQETFLRAYQNIDRYDQSRPAGPWLFKIASNLCRNWLRDNSEKPLSLCDIAPESPERDPEAQYLAREKESELKAALDAMPEMYREVLLLKHVAELSYSEICEALNLDLSLVKNRLYRGRILLKDKLKEGVPK